jgi:hypothetical protein
LRGPVLWWHEALAGASAEHVPEMFDSDLHGDAPAENVVEAFVRDIEGYAKFGIETVMLGPRTGEQAAWIEQFVATAVRRAAELG